MAEGTFNLGDYEVSDDSNGDYVIKEPNGNIIFQWDDSAGDWLFKDASGTTVGQYDSSTGEWDFQGKSIESTRTENTLSDTGKAQLLDVASTTAEVTVIDETNGEISTWFLRGSNNDAQKLFDSNTHFTNTEDNDTTINVYWDATNSRYEVNNETGGQITVAAIDVRES